MTATLDKARRLSQEAFVTRDRLAGGLAPAERLGSLEPGAAGTCRGSRHEGGGAAPRIRVAAPGPPTRNSPDLRPALGSGSRHPAARPPPPPAWPPQTPP